MTDPGPSLEDVRKIIGTYSIASVSNWLKRCDLPSSAHSRDEIAARVYGLIEKGDLTIEGLTAAMIGIEEASSKRTFLFKVSHSPIDLKKVDKQLADMKVTLSTVRAPATHPKSIPHVVYAINGPIELRVKWTELHKRVKAVHKTRSWEETNVPKVIVLVIDKKTGRVQLRCDKPEDEHAHMQDGIPNDDAYYNHFKEQAENLTGLPFEPLEMRAGLEKILMASPRIVRTSYTVDEAEDGGYTQRSQKKKNKDVRDTEGWQNITTSKLTRTFEEAPVRWLKEMSDGGLNREVYSYIDAANNMIRFDADCYEEEIEYVLNRLVSP